MVTRVKNMKRLFLVILPIVLVASSANAQKIHFTAVDKTIIQSRLQEVGHGNEERKATLARMFASAGCEPTNITEQPVKHEQLGNLICKLPGSTNSVIVIGAHFDHADQGDGVADNWSGAALLPSLLQSLRDEPRQHTFYFVAFSGEEDGLAGSKSYVETLSPDERKAIEAMVNLDTLGLGPTKVSLSSADQTLTKRLAQVAHAMALPIEGANVGKVGTADSEAFHKAKIPSITIHSLTQETLPIVNSARDRMDAIKMDDYYNSYRLIAGYAAFLDAIETGNAKTAP